MQKEKVKSNIKKQKIDETLPELEGTLKHVYKNKLVLGIGAGVMLVLVVTGSVLGMKALSRAGNQRHAAAWTPAPSTSPQVSTGCKLPQKTVAEHGFSVGVPSGWLYEFNNGTVSIMKDKANLEGVFLYTAKLTKKDLTAQGFLTASAGFFEKSVAADGGSFKVTGVKTTGSKAEGTIDASMTSTPITGTYRVDKDGDFITLRAYYAPTRDMSGSRGTLEQVAGCFARTTKLTDQVLAAATKSQERETVAPSGFSKYTGKYFSLALPSNFRVTGESDSGIDTTRSDGSAGFSYAYVTGAKGPYTPDSWTRYALPKFAQIQRLSLGSGTDVASQVPGMKVQAFEFTGVLNGSTSVRGKVTTGVINTTDYGMGSSTSAFWAVQIGTPAAWSGAASTLQQMQDSIAIINIGATRKNTMLPPNRPMESSGGSSVTSRSSSSISDESNANWSEAMRGYETVESPSTGDHYDVPLNSWDPSGPAGAGYNRTLPNGDTELLTQD